MPVIEVANRFILNLGEGVPQVEYAPGRYEVTDEVAEHWYVKANLVGAKPVNTTMTTAQKMLIVEQAVRMHEPVDAQEQEPAKQSNVLEASTKPEHFFAGAPQSDQSKLSLARGPKR
jgi:hypothetical protein